MEVERGIVTRVSFDYETIPTVPKFFEREAKKRGWKMTARNLGIDRRKELDELRALSICQN